MEVEADMDSRGVMDSREVTTKAWVEAWAVDLVDSKVTGVASKVTVVDNKVLVVAKWVAVVVMASREVLGDPQGVLGRVESTTNTTTNTDRRGEGDTAAVGTRQLVAAFSAK